MIIVNGFLLLFASLAAIYSPVSVSYKMNHYIACQFHGIPSNSAIKGYAMMSMDYFRVVAWGFGLFLLGVFHPAFPGEEVLNICFDEAHNNYQKAEEGYKPYIQLLENNGFYLTILEDKFEKKTLSACNLLVIVNPVAKANIEDWSYPHFTAFGKQEIQAIGNFVYQGGGLFVIGDHMPIPGALADLVGVFGITIIDGEARNTTRSPLPDIFQREDETLQPHPITEGRNPEEKVIKVATYNGNAFKASREWKPLLVYGPLSRSWLDLTETFPDLPAKDWPVYEVEGWLQAAAREWGKGRIVYFAEVAQCTEQVNQTGPWGMNAPEAEGNKQFCLNTVLWLVNKIK